MNKFASLIYLLTISEDLCPVIDIILLSSTPESAADVAKPDLKLWPEKFLLSIPAKSKYSLISKATVWSVNLFSDNFDPLINLLKMGPLFIFDRSSNLFNDLTGQYCELRNNAPLEEVQGGMGDIFIRLAKDN